MRILVAGDYCPIERTLGLIDTKSYGILFDDVRPYIDSADYSIVNLECPICLGNYAPIYKQGPNLQVKTKNAVEALKYAGFDMVTLANNHILDYGEEGLSDTMQVCQEYGLDMVGAGKNLEAANQVFYKQINNEILAIINCCEHEFSIATQEKGGSNPLNPVQQYNQIQEAKKNADYVLVIVHGGHEHFQLPSPRMKETYRFFIDAGADAVVNHHQHCFSGREIYKEKSIYYGLGNYLFDRLDSDKTKFSIWNEGFMLILDFCDNKIKTEEIPYIQCYVKPKLEMQEDSKAFGDKFRQLNEIIADDIELNNTIKQYYEEETNSLDIIWEPYMNRYMRKLRRMKLIPSFISKRKLTNILNIIDCESHRDKLLYYLHKRNKE